MKPAVSPIASDDLVLRELSYDDLHYTLSWRNRDQVRRWFKHSEVISPEQHEEWFRQYTTRPNDYVFVVWRGSERIGQVAIYDIDRTNGVAEIGRFVVAPDMAGKGLMTRAISALCGIARTHFGLEALKLEVLSENERAISLYRRLGFVTAAVDGNLLHMELKLV